LGKTAERQSVKFVKTLAVLTDRQSKH